jgi:molybdate transport system permease protein
VDWQAIALSLRLSAGTTLVLMAFGIPLAYWLANTRFRGRFLIEAVVALPIVLPPTVMGFYVLMAIGPLSPLGSSITLRPSLAVYFPGLLVALGILQPACSTAPYQHPQR